ncbi:hypothetical protein C8Q70DRAFT_954766 [Cubamyces menziesii]|nr:hypothetical protein C8Q70DRAFT_954766 [Cubamyces menziesii]
MPCTIYIHTRLHLPTTNYQEGNRPGREGEAGEVLAKRKRKDAVCVSAVCILGILFRTCCPVSRSVTTVPCVSLSIMSRAYFCNTFMMLLLGCISRSRALSNPREIHWRRAKPSSH